LFLWQLAIAAANLRQRAVLVAAPEWLAAAVALIAAAYLIQLGGWLLAMRFLRCALTFGGSYAGYYLSFLPRYIPGTVWGYLGRSEWLARSHGIGYRRSSIGSLLEAGSFVATALVIGALVYLQPPWEWIAALALAVGAAAAWPLLARTGGVLPAGKQWALIPIAYFAYFCYWVVQGLGLSAICRAVGVGQGVPLVQLVAASAVGWSAGFLMLFVPAGFGVRELSLTYLLTTEAGMAPGDANLVAVLSRVCMIGVELLMLATALLWRRGSHEPALTETSKL
jgi:hypothetical protein